MTGKKTLLMFLSSLFNLIIIVLGSTAIIRQLCQVTIVAGISLGGLDTFRYFTNDGNIFCIISAGIALFFNLLSIRKKQILMPVWVYLLRLASAVSSLIIFLVVIIILIPTMDGMLSGFNLVVLHGINPLLCLFLFLIFDKQSERYKFYHSFLGSLPVLIYGIIAISFITTQAWSKEMIPYPFLRFYENPVYQSVVSCIGFLLTALILSFLLSFINKYLTRKIYK
ncbi:MAG: hypothetical protein WCR67_06685 [Bacilli bacterium]